MRSKRFAGAMQVFGDGPDVRPSFLVENFPWTSLGAGIIVDLGGSKGSASLAIAEAHPELRFVVQDREETIKAAKKDGIPSHLVTRINFMTHDFFTEQPVTADVYLLRYILHNWPDAYAIKILRQLIPALKPGARVIVNDHLLPEPNTLSLIAERKVRCV